MGAAIRRNRFLCALTTLHGGGCDDLAFLFGAPFEVFLGKQPRFPGSISYDYTTLLCGLDVTLEVAADTISDRDEAELGFVEHVPMFRGKLEQTLGEPVVVLLLLHGVVEGRVPKVLCSVCD